MITLGFVFLFTGVLGLAHKTWDVLREMDDPLLCVSAKVAKMRIEEPEENEGKVRYIVTFFLLSAKRYIRLSVTKTQYDEILANDAGMLTFREKIRKFEKWELL